MFFHLWNTTGDILTVFVLKMNVNEVQNNSEPHWLSLYGDIFYLNILLCSTEECESYRFGMTWENYFWKQTNALNCAVLWVTKILNHSQGWFTWLHFTTYLPVLYTLLFKSLGSIIFVLFYFILSCSKDPFNWSKVAFLILQKISKINANGSEGSYDTNKIQFCHYGQNIFK